ncbi:MAG: hypothetical protein ABI857_00335 [Acidobacteriota bacterium]
MFQRINTEKDIWRWRWPLIVIVVLAILFGIRVLQINKREPISHQAPAYTTTGRLMWGDVTVPAGDHFSMWLELNRRAKVSGAFRTSEVKRRVSVLVIKDSEFDSWKLDLNYDFVSRTGYVPGGKINPVLEAGTYFLIIDNRRNNYDQLVRAEFSLE